MGIKMVSVFMISRGVWRRSSSLPAALFLIETACNRVPLLAPSGSNITLTTATSVLAINGSATIIAQVIENAGTPPQAGTHVTFTTSLGTIQPSDATTDSSGRATATFTSHGVRHRDHHCDFRGGHHWRKPVEDPRRDGRCSESGGQCDACDGSVGWRLERQ